MIEGSIQVRDSKVQAGIMALTMNFDNEISWIAPRGSIWKKYKHVILQFWKKEDEWLFWQSKESTIYEELSCKRG